MAATVEQIEAEALSLPIEGHAHLAEHFMARFDADAETEKAWAKEIKHRVQALGSSAIKSIPALRM